MLGIRAHNLLPIWDKGKDSKKPNTRPTYTVRPVRTPLEPAGRSPPRSRAPRRGPRQLPLPSLRSRVANLPSGKRVNSASLEGNEPTLGKADQLHLARGHPSTERTNGPSAQPPAVRRHQTPTTPLQHPGQMASGRHSAQQQHPEYCPPTPVTAPRRCSNTVGTCDALCGRARHCSCHCTAYSVYLLCCRPLEWHGHDPRARPEP